MMVDGGILENFPIHIFDQTTTGSIYDRFQNWIISTN
jgi:hypothetical protein